MQMWDEVVASMASADDSWLHSIKSSLLKQGQQHKSTDDDTQMLQDIFMSMVSIALRCIAFVCI